MVGKNGHVEKLNLRTAKRDNETGMVENQIVSSNAVDATDAAGKSGCLTSASELLKPTKVALTHQGERGPGVPDVATDWMFATITIDDEGIIDEGARGVPAPCRGELRAPLREERRSARRGLALGLVIRNGGSARL